MLRLFTTPWTVAHQAPPSLDSPGENSGVGCCFLLQGISLPQGSNPRPLCLLHYRQILSPLSHWRRLGVCKCITESLGCTPEMNTTLLTRVHCKTQDEFKERNRLSHHPESRLVPIQPVSFPLTGILSVTVNCLAFSRMRYRWNRVLLHLVFFCNAGI